MQFCVWVCAYTAIKMCTQHNPNMSNNVHTFPASDGPRETVAELVIVLLLKDLKYS